MADTNATRSRSRSPRGEGSAVAAKAYKKFSESFETWAKKHHSDENDNDLFAMYKRGLRSKANYVAELSADPEFEVDELAENHVKAWAWKEAKKEMKRQSKPKKTKKDKKDNLKKSKKEDRKEKPDNKLSEKKESENKESEQNEKDAATTEVKHGEGSLGLSDCQALAIPNEVSPLHEVLISLKEELEVAEEKHTKIEQKVTQLTATQKRLVDALPPSAKKLKDLEKSVASIPRVKQIFIKHKDAHTKLIKERDVNAIALEAAKVKLKEMKAKIKKLEKDVQTLSSQIDRDEARLAEAAESDSEEDAQKQTNTDKCKVIFSIMDRDETGLVSRCDFIKSLVNEQVAEFFKLPSTIRQEDGTRGEFETIFQKIAGESKTFDSGDLEVWAAAHKV